ncbi:phage-related protein [Mesorhizobium sangaii]|uniref:Phage-related protein n=1 Tax=Mesorhizobium sangaii TaxID=505389 RepID=A0A841P393_9HYPH|nr:phage-related protein [Mesorhizobium sangaii]
MPVTKRLEFLGDSLARKETGVQLHKVQLGLEPSDWKPMTNVGPGVREIRIRDDAGCFMSQA